MTNPLIPKEAIQEVQVAPNHHIKEGTIIHYDDRVFTIDGLTNIFFTVNNQKYNLILYKENNTWHPLDVVHHTVEEEHVCFFCHTALNRHYSNLTCESLKEHKDELFELFINLPSVRLKFLF